MKLYHARVTLVYQGKQYTFIYGPYDFRFDKDSAEDDHTAILYHWQEGNMACDHNRARVIRAHCDPDFPLLDQCGDAIELVRVEPVEVAG